MCTSTSEDLPSVWPHKDLDHLWILPSNHNPRRWPSVFLPNSDLDSFQWEPDATREMLLKKAALWVTFQQSNPFRTLEKTDFCLSNSFLFSLKQQISTVSIFDSYHVFFEVVHDRRSRADDVLAVPAQLILIVDLQALQSEYDILLFALMDELWSKM